MAGRRRTAVRTYERRPGKWSVIWREHGTQREQRGHANQAEAEDYAAEIRERLRTGLSGAREARTIGRVVAHWYDSFVTTEEIKPASRAGYKADMQRILELCGDESAHITTSRVREIRNDAAKLYGARAANKIHTALSSAYRVGLQHDPPLVESNPCLGIKRLPETGQGWTAPTRLHVEYLERTAPSDRELALFLIASRCAVRQSELFGLTWDHTKPNALQIATVADPVTRRQRDSTKTKRSERRVPMPPRTASVVWARRPTPLKKGALMFPSHSDPTRPLARAPFLRTYWHPWLAVASELAKEEGQPESVWAALLELKWKHLRHYGISAWAAAGATIMQVSRWSGDSIATIDKHYGFLFDEDEEDVMALID